MNERCRTSSGLFGSGVGILLEDTAYAKDVGVPLRQAVSADVALFVSNQIGDEGAVFVRRGALVFRERGKPNFVDVFGLSRVRLNVSTSCLALGGSVEPGAAQLGSPNEGCSRRNAWPSFGAVDETFFETLREHIAQTGGMAFRVDNDDGPIAASPKGALPTVVTTNLLGDVGKKVLHEGRKLSGMVNAEEGVHVIAHHGQGENSNPEQLLGASNDSENQVVAGRPRPQQKSAPNRAGGDLDNCARRNESERTRHALSISDGTVVRC